MFVLFGIEWNRERPASRHIVGRLIFGLGWGIADACPGPFATQVVQGITWGLWALAGVIIACSCSCGAGSRTPSRRAIRSHALPAQGRSGRL